MISNRQRQVINGTILGGSSLILPINGKNPYLAMRSSDFNWIKYKAGELFGLSPNNKICQEKTYRWHSKCLPDLKEFEIRFYKDHKRSLNRDSLDLLTDVAFAVWYGDCGHYKSEKIILNTHIWGEDGTNVIFEFLNIVDFTCKIVKERNNFRIKLDKNSSKEFVKLIKPHYIKA